MDASLPTQLNKESLLEAAFSYARSCRASDLGTLSTEQQQILVLVETLQQWGIIPQEPAAEPAIAPLATVLRAAEELRQVLSGPAAQIPLEQARADLELIQRYLQAIRTGYQPGVGTSATNIHLDASEFVPSTVKARIERP